MDLQEAFDAGFEAVKAYVDGIEAKMAARLDALEKQLSTIGPTVDGIGATIGEEVAKAVAALPAPKDGKDADPEVIKAEVATAVAAAVAALPPAAPGEPGKSVTVDDVAPMLNEAVSREVEKAVAALPPAEPGRPGEPGKSVTADDVRPLIEAEVEKAMSAIPAPKDGINLAGAVIDRDGNLVLTLSDGKTVPLGRVVGKDADETAIAKLIEAEIAKFPRPKDGLDGLGFDDLTVEHDGERGIVLRFVRGEQVKEFRAHLPVMLYRGVFNDGHTYERGDTVTWGGHLWHCNEETRDKPGTSKSWTLAAKRGRDGSDAKVR